MPRYSISQITTVGQSFADDLDAYRAAGGSPLVTLQPVPPAPNSFSSFDGLTVSAPNSNRRRRRRPSWRESLASGRRGA